MGTISLKVKYYSIFFVSFQNLVKLKENLKFMLLLATVGSGYRAQAFSSCDEQGLLSGCHVQTSCGGGRSCCGARALGHTGFSSGSA